MRFEIPTMNISMFEVENIIASGTEPVADLNPAAAKANAVAQKITNVNKVLTFTDSNL